MIALSHFVPCTDRNCISQCISFEQETSLLQGLFQLVQGLRAIQPRIQAWLGRAAGAADALVVQAIDSQAKPAVPGERARWDSDNKLGIAVPFPEDHSLVLWLDKTLPQV